MFNYLFCSILAVLAPVSDLLETQFGDPLLDGWVSVEKKIKKEEQGVDDESIWILFSKKIGSEKFFVRFPTFPSYYYDGEGALVVRSEKRGEIYELTIQKKAKLLSSTLKAEESLEEGKWMHETTIQTDQHVYRFYSQLLDSDPSAHEKFVSSISINSSEKGSF